MASTSAGSSQSAAVGMEQVIRPTQVTMPSASMSPQGSAAIGEPTKKLRGRQRLLQGMRRMASSTSLTRTAVSSGTTAAGYNASSRGSMSCTSLASPVPMSPLAFSHGRPPYLHSRYNSQDSAPFSTAPTSQSNTPPPPGVSSIAPPEMRWNEKSRLRILGRQRSSSRPSTPMTAPLPADLRLRAPLSSTCSEQVPGNLNDYFSIPVQATSRPRRPQPSFEFWTGLPHELSIRILSLLEPKEIVRASAVSRKWHSMCYDGQLWKNLDFSTIHREIPADSLVKILTEAGPFVKDLNLRGCVQMHDRWQQEGQIISDLCRNMEYLSLKDCKIDRRSVHFFILRNPKLVHVDLSQVSTINNTALRILAQTCTQIRYLDVSWCPQVDTAGLMDVVNSCKNLTELRAGKMHGWNSEKLMLRLFENNTLETLMLPHCSGLDDDSLLLLLQGDNPEIDCLTGKTIVPPRRLRHLDLTGAKRLTAKSIKALHGNAPDLQSLCLHGCTSLSDDALVPLFSSVPHLTHLDLEELGQISNAVPSTLANSPCASTMRHLSLSHCENVSDTGLVPLIKACKNLRNLEVDNTRAGDITLHEAAATMHTRNLAALSGTDSGKPELSLRLVAYDCANVTWTGVLAVLEKNAEFFHRSHGSSQPVYPCDVINLKCFYGFQPTVDEHTKRVLRGELAKATILARKWHDWMQASEEAGAQGAGGWRRRRRAREAGRQVEGEGAPTDSLSGRRRARSGGCTVM